jgi:type IV secretion system protein VirB11
MNAPLRNIYLESYLAPLAEWLGQDDVTDIFVNRPGEIWVETLGEGPRQIAVPELTREVLLRLVRQIASVSSQGISREHPLLAATLPGGERVQAVIAPATRGETALAIRKHVVAGLSLEDYRSSGAIAVTKFIGSNALPARDARLAESGDCVDMLREAVLDRRNILVSGGTSSGKTTLINALLREIPEDERLILIEDTPELQLVHTNSVGLVAARGSLGEAEVSAEDLLIASLRMRPDRIILGEIRGPEAVTFLRTVNTGHPGSMSTIHADSPQRAIDQLALLVLQAGTQMGWDDVVHYVRNSIDIIVQLSRSGGRREVASVLVME